jgi:hypothetical protein
MLSEIVSLIVGILSLIFRENLTFAVLNSVELRLFTKIDQNIFCMDVFVTSENGINTYLMF